MIGWLLLALLLLPTAAWARPVVLELFTSEACSACPPADALLGRLQETERNLLPLDLHVTYFNGPGWADPYSLPAATERQEWYERLGRSNALYTPEAVVDGKTALVGSDRPDILSAISRARPDAAHDPVRLSLITTGDRVRVAVGHGSGMARIWLFGYDDRHVTHIGGGENSGATLTEVDVVRSVTLLGTWNGQEARFAAVRPRGQHLAVVLQRDDGTILGAVR